jgi:hypothetical protein
MIDQIKMRCKFLTQDRYFKEDTEPRNIYRIYLTWKNKTISFRFGDSLKNTEKGIMLDESDKANILEICLSDYNCTKENYPSLESFSKEFGYDEDSIKTLQIYKRVLKQGEKLHKIFTKEDIKNISEDLNNE